MDAEATLVWMAAQAFVVASILCVILMIGLHRSRRELQHLRASLAAAQQSIPRYLQSEIQRCRDQLRTGAVPEAERLLTSVRHRWLNAEQAALREAGATSADDAVLGVQLAPVIKALQTQTTQQPPDIEQRLAAQRKQLEKLQHYQSLVDGLQVQLAAANRRVSILEGQRRSMSAQEEADHFHAETTRQVKQLHSTLQAHVDTVAALRPGVQRYPLGEHERESLHQSIREAEHNAVDMRTRMSDMVSALNQAKSEYETQKAQRGEQASVLVLSDADGKPVGQTRHWVDDESGRFADYEKELRRLQESNAAQRKLILQLETQLSGLRGHETDYQETEALIGKLKLQLRDSEMCTAVLEAETDSLRERLRGTAIIEDAVATPASPRPGREAEIISFVRALIDTTGLESLALLIARFAASLGLDATVHIRGRDQHHWLKLQGKVEDRARNMLQGLELRPQSPWTHLKEGEVLILKRSRYLFGNWPPSDEGLRELLFSLLSVADMAVYRLDNQHQALRQKQALEKLVAEARRTLESIDIQQRYVMEEGGRALEQYQDEVKSFVDSLNVSDVQRQCLEDMTIDFQQRLGLLFSNRHVVDRSFTRLLDMLGAEDNAASQHEPSSQTA